MTPAWSGGQYSLYRAVFGACLLAHFIRLLPFGLEILSVTGSPSHAIFPNLPSVWNSPAAVLALLVIGVSGSLALLFGRRDRIAAVALSGVWLGLFARNPRLTDLGWVFVGCLLVIHVFVPSQPFGSWDARGRLDPDSGWRMPSALYTAAWIVMALGYFYLGATKLANPAWIDGSALVGWSLVASELLFAPLALFARIRPWLWLVLLSIHLGVTLIVGSSDLSAGLILIHFFTFDPDWIAPRLPKWQQPQEGLDGHTLVFYDGACGLCHRTIRFLLAEDAIGLRFRFACLDSEAFRDACAEDESGFETGEPIPDSLLVHRPGEAMLTRADGVLEIGHQLGGLWRLLAVVAGWVPRAISNAGYDFVARIRHRLFARPDDACPLLTAELGDRFRF